MEMERGESSPSVDLLRTESRRLRLYTRVLLKNKEASRNPKQKNCTNSEACKSRSFVWLDYLYFLEIKARVVRIFGHLDLSSSALFDQTRRSLVQDRKACCAGQ